MSRRALALAALAATQLIVVLDGTIVTIALPSIRADLGFTDADLAWVVNAFFIAFAAVLLPAGRLGDRIGTRPVFLGGLTVFVLATVWCALAWDPAGLVLARVLQGIGGGLASAVALGMIAALFPEADARSRAFAVLAFVGSAGGAIGVLAGGVLTELTSWRWVFWINVPVVLAVLALAAVVIERRPGSGASGGLVPRGLFANRRFGIAGAVLFTMVTAGMSFQFLTSLYLQDTLGLSPMATGFGFLTVTTTIAIASLGLSARLAAAHGAERILLVGLMLFAAGMVLMVRLPDAGSYWVDVAPALALMGTGFGLAMPQATELAMSAAPPEHAGAASGFVTTVQQAGGAFGLFVIATAAAETSRAVGYALAAAALLVGIGLAATLRGRRPAAVGEAVDEGRSRDLAACSD